MIRGTTPVITAIYDEDIRGAEIHMLIEQGNVHMDKTGDDIQVVGNNGRTYVYAPLTQEETFALVSGSPVQVQLRWKKGEGVFATRISRLSVDEILSTEIL